MLWKKLFEIRAHALMKQIMFFGRVNNLFQLKY